MDQAKATLEETADNVSFRNEHPALGDSKSELLAGLQETPKTVNPKYFYDEQGSQLFDQITRQPEYYPTRTEVGILTRYSRQISARCGPGCLLIEPGSGSCEKVRLLLDDLSPAAYVPIDISAEFLQHAAFELAQEYPWLDVQAVCADFGARWSFVDDLPQGKRVVFYPGSTIGNLEPDDACRFLGKMREVVGTGGGLVVGVDLHKSSERLTAAYNDASGVTAQFNLNVLQRLNELLDADFNRDDFRHHAFYNSERRRIEMHLVSEKDQLVQCAKGELALRKGETIHTENSYKYTTEGFAELAAKAGLTLTDSWIDDEGLFSVHYLSA
tara:strand:+ start:452757 stop:453740 length:984 start_codon:yes stop_codon:yes gene_type:complete